ncbi:site-specific DNA-methyltransferase [Neorhizobium galegae]|nr:site-specific DNA-methyltransferase [Neorhizobium galegae]MCQ1799676.1 site-specific DNA-methyltransferase [Neorhizobium galegae]
MEFAEWALGRLALPPGALIIDPWNGSGTTAAACARVGISCQGYDINPVMVHLGRARVASQVDFDEAEELIGSVDQIVSPKDSTDLKAIGLAFRELPVGNEYAHSVAVAALFPYARSLLNVSRTKNPSWFKKGATFDGMSIERSTFFPSWIALLAEISKWRSTQDDADGVVISIERGDSRKSLGRKDAFDGILTSPPYLTRLDYVQATLPEFLLLKEFDIVPDMQRLRRSMLGSPLTSERPDWNVERLPETIRDLLRRIESHTSKASASYYYRFFSTYFVDLQASMRNIAKVLKAGGSGCIVVQSSNYKEINIDLAAAIVVIGEEFGMRHEDTIEFKSRRSISLVNTRAHHDARQPKSECAVFFRKT